MQWGIGILGAAITLFWPDIGSENIILSGLTISITKVFAAALIVNASLITAGKYCNRQGMWSFLGKRSLEIYTLHPFITSGIRPLFKVMYMDNYWVNAVVGIFLGIAIPVICSYMLKKLKLWDIIYKPFTFWKNSGYKREII